MYIVGVLFAIIIIVILVCYFVYTNGLKAISTKDEPVEFIVESGSTYYSLSNKLYESGLIKSELSYKIYIKLNSPKKELTAGTYELNRNMDVSTILATLEKGGKSVSEEQISITFQEGINMRRVAKIIANNTSNKESDVYNLLKDKIYLNDLIKKYWFIDKSILNENIYYPLEGYLYMDTYFFSSVDVSVEEIFETMLNEMEKKLAPFKEEFAESDYSTHEILTLASMIELEAKTPEDREGVSGVFFNRLKARMSLGSDVTTYYGAQIDMSERDLYQAEIDATNGYNTRPASMAGKIPVGPICNPSSSSIDAALHPTTSNYYYFVSDNTGKVYFASSYEEHLSVIQDLKDKNLWERY